MAGNADRSKADLERRRLPLAASLSRPEPPGFFPMGAAQEGRLRRQSAGHVPAEGSDLGRRAPHHAGDVRQSGSGCEAPRDRLRC